MKTTTTELHVAITGAPSGLREALARAFSRDGRSTTDTRVMDSRWDTL